MIQLQIGQKNFKIKSTNNKEITEQEYITIIDSDSVKGKMGKSNLQKSTKKLLTVKQIVKILSK